MAAPREEDLNYLDSVSRSDFGKLVEVDEMKQDSLITSRSAGNKIKYYKNLEYIHKEKSKILKYLRYQYGLEIYASIYEDMKRYELKIMKLTQEFSELVNIRKSQVHNDHAVYSDYIATSENGLRILNESDNRITYKRFLENMANNILLTLFNKSIRIWTLRLTENYEKYRVEQRIGYEMYVEGGRKILDMLNYQIFWINHNIHNYLTSSFQENCNILNDFGEIIRQNEEFSNLDIPEALMDEQKLIENLLGMIKFFDRFSSNWVELTEKLEEFKFHEKAIPAELEVWGLKNKYEQEVTAHPYLAAAVKYLSKKLRKVEHRLAVYETVSRLDKIDECVNNANACISAVTDAINSMYMSGDVHLRISTSTYSNSHTSFTYNVSTVWDDFDLHKSTIVANIADASQYPKHEKTLDNEKEKAGLLADLSAAVERLKVVVEAAENLNASKKRLENYFIEKESNIKFTKDLIGSLKSRYEMFIEEHQTPELVLKKELILPWYCMLITHLNVTNPRKFVKFDKKYDFLATHLHPKYIVEILYEILLRNQKIREKKFRIFGKDETKKVFNCEIISLDLLIELYTHPRIFGCFRDDQTGEAQKIEKCSRTENCKSSFFKCIRETVKIIIIGELIHSDINKEVNEERIRNFQKHGLGLLNECGYNRIREKVKSYKMKLTKKAKTKS